jgi:hypothetical protein
MKLHKAFVLIVILGMHFIFQQSQATVLPGFHKSIYNYEQVKVFTNAAWAPQVYFHINAPSAENFDPEKETALIFFATPNGNTIEHTIGNTDLVEEDWHYNIQHIGAQTRFLRSIRTDVNVVVCYLQPEQLSWSAWRSVYPDEMIGNMVDSVASVFEEYTTNIVLSGHSGGGNWVFGYINSQESIPENVKRITFLDSNYGYDEAFGHGSKLAAWLQADSGNALSVIAYNDSVALYNGEPIVSPTGGTWYRSKRMIEFLQDYFTFSDTINDDFWKYYALDHRISFVLKTNPDQIILHTVQVERNGFIHCMLTGTDYEEQNYTYYPLQPPYHVYDDYIQSGLTLAGAQFPERPENAIQGSDFMDMIGDMSLESREDLIFEEIASGNMPGFCKTFKTITIEEGDQTCTYEVLMDYLAVGSDTNFCRVPISPELAQRIADYFGCSLPTTKMVDAHWQNADRKIQPITHAPSGNDNEQVWMFVLHNQEIEDALNAQGTPWDRYNTLVDGLKKDVVITNNLATNPGKVAIYGWYKLDGTFWQPLYLGHTSSYMDYSHGIRFVNMLVNVNETPMNIRNVLGSASLYSLLSDETGVMEQPYYVYETSNPLPLPPKTFGVKVLDNETIQVVTEPDQDGISFEFYKSTDGTEYSLIHSGSDSALTVGNLIPGEKVFIKLKSLNITGTSVSSEVLTVIPGDNLSDLLIVQGFDRASAGNSFDFMKYHAESADVAGIGFDAATNEAVKTGLFNLSDYRYVDYVLGEESTVDETFDNQEQTLVKAYLDKGGYLFVSGAEIAWDLDYKGSSSDKDFYHNYLKSRYQYDAPGNLSGTYYTAKGLEGYFFESIPEFNYDNGNHGTFNVRYPDQIEPNAGGVPAFEYVGPSATAIAGVLFSGYFPAGTEPGKLVNLGFPLETVYVAEDRDSIFKKVIDFFNSDYTSIKEYTEKAFSIFPNPAKDNFYIRLNKEIGKNAEIILFNSFGSIQRKIYEGNYPLSETIDISALSYPPGIYFCMLKTDQVNQIEKLVIAR